MPTGITPPVAGERITVVMMSAYIAKSPRCTGKIVRVIFLQIDLYQRQTATMSALGQKQTYAVQNVMSALPPKAEQRAALASNSALNALGETMSDEELKAEIERLRSENAALKKGATSGIRMKVSEKGGVSVYGMGRFPVTLYKEQWLKLLDMSDDIRAFIAANDAQLKAKHDK